MKNKKQILEFICGFSIVFSLFVFVMILLFIWPNPLPSFDHYPIQDTEIAILLAAGFSGLMGGLVATLFGEFGDWRNL